MGGASLYVLEMEQSKARLNTIMADMVKELLSAIEIDILAMGAIGKTGRPCMLVDNSAVIIFPGDYQMFNSCGEIITISFANTTVK